MTTTQQPNSLAPKEPADQKKAIRRQLRKIENALLYQEGRRGESSLVPDLMTQIMKIENLMRRETTDLRSFGSVIDELGDLEWRAFCEEAPKLGREIARLNRMIEPDPPEALAA